MSTARLFWIVVLTACTLAGCAGTVDRCTADTSPPDDGVQQPAARR
jgi:hypothetical protein